MRYSTDIHKNKVYIRPKPQEDIKEGLILMLNKPRGEGLENFLATDVQADKKRYDLPELPIGIWIVGAFVKNGEE